MEIEKHYYTIETIAKEWSCEESDILHLFEIGKLNPSVYVHEFPVIVYESIKAEDSVFIIDITKGFLTGAFYTNRENDLKLIRGEEAVIKILTFGGNGTFRPSIGNFESKLAAINLVRPKHFFDHYSCEILRKNDDGDETISRYKNKRIRQSIDVSNHPYLFHSVDSSNLRDLKRKIKRYESKLTEMNFEKYESAKVKYDTETRTNYQQICETIIPKSKYTDIFFENNELIQLDNIKESNLFFQTIPEHYHIYSSVDSNPHVEIDKYQSTIYGKDYKNLIVNSSCLRITESEKNKFMNSTNSNSLNKNEIHDSERDNLLKTVAILVRLYSQEKGAKFKKGADNININQLTKKIVDYIVDNNIDAKGLSQSSLQKKIKKGLELI